MNLSNVWVIVYLQITVYASVNIKYNKHNQDNNLPFNIIAEFKFMLFRWYAQINNLSDS
jgi:hypothetical protein